MNAWQGKVAVVTGASSGLGQAIARALVERGASVVAGRSRRGQTGRRGCGSASRGKTVLAVPTDVTRAEDVERLIARTLTQFGRIDCAVQQRRSFGARLGDRDLARGIRRADGLEPDWVGAMHARRYAAPARVARPPGEHRLAGWKNGGPIHGCVRRHQARGERLFAATAFGAGTAGPACAAGLAGAHGAG